MIRSSGSPRADLSTEFGFAVVGGVALVCTAPGRVRRHVSAQVTRVVDSALGVAGAWAAHIGGLASRIR